MVNEVDIVRTANSLGYNLNELEISRVTEIVTKENKDLVETILILKNE